MIKIQYNIPLYDIDVTMIQVENEKDKNVILACMRNIKCDQEYIDSVDDYVTRGCFNGGDTFRNFDLRKMLVIFYPQSDEETRWEVYMHEKRHIEDRVMEFTNVKDIESAALLAGFLACKFYQFTQMVHEKLKDNA